MAYTGDKYTIVKLIVDKVCVQKSGKRPRLEAVYPRSARDDGAANP